MFAAGKTKGASAAVAATYIEDVFSTWLYTGTGANQTITNGIDLAGKGGLVWMKSRGLGYLYHSLNDTARGTNLSLFSNDTSGQIASGSPSLTAFNSNGFSIGTNAYVNTSADTLVSWTFRKQPKFFDVVTFTTASDASATVNHSLGSTPGFVVIKRTDNTSAWSCWHNGLPSTNYEIRLNSTGAQNNIGGPWLTVSSTQVTFPGTSGYNNLAASASYVMYLFAHNAGGFGMTGTDNVISCGSFTTDTSGNATVNLGYEPQWVLTKRVDTSGNWVINDNMRGMPASQTSQVLYPNLSNAESSSIYFSTQPNATGFTTQNYANTSYDGIAATVIYIAIRRGPMKTPTSGTSVFTPVALPGASGTNQINAGFPIDFVSFSTRNATTGKLLWHDRLRGPNQYIQTSSTGAENNSQTLVNTVVTMDNMTGITLNDPNGSWGGNPSYNYIDYFMRRAPGFFDEVCWNGTNSDQTLNHNLGVVPELLIFKPRTQAGYNWEVSTKYTGSDYLRLVLQLTNAGSTLAYSGGGPIPAAPTATQFSVGQFYNPTGGNVAYLFASCPGVSKVGSYTGNGTTQTINCGFTGGARLVLIKRTDNTGDWYVYDTARGMTTLTDPYLLMNSTAAESATLGSVTTVSTGFAVNASILAAINTNAASYIFLAIA